MVLPLRQHRGNGATKIDTIFTNMPAKHAVHKVQYMYTESKSFDHVPLRLTLNYFKFQDLVRVATQPATINLPDKSGLSMKQRKSEQIKEAKLFRKM